MDLDLSELTDAQLSTLKTNLLASLNATATTGESYAIGQRSLKRGSLKETAELLSAVNREIRQRADTTGGLIYVEFGEPQ